ncbi:hypothetical protein ACFFGT_32005 [Mucilaginibacter angelicae]|uniref:Uncharacterized protein n=1 Tax=Mucilaginibacter angelicae TaxID=869718 RepID=A0ABV6LHC4_9SPHI
MITKAQKEDMDELEAKVLEGMKRANRKLIEAAAANNESLSSVINMAVSKQYLQKSF